jgi:hypothetical protein
MKLAAVGQVDEARASFRAECHPDVLRGVASVLAVELEHQRVIVHQQTPGLRQRNVTLEQSYRQ